jgi:hypothetical protein
VQMQMHPNAYQGYGQQMGYGMPMNMNVGVPMVAGGYDEGISSQQRDNIDRWRLSVAPQ